MADIIQSAGEKEAADSKAAQMKAADYCTPQRCENRHKIASTNKKGFSSKGYTQNPRSYDATIALIRAGGIPCPKNPFVTQSQVLIIRRGL